MKVLETVQSRPEVTVLNDLFSCLNAIIEIDYLKGPQLRVNNPVFINAKILVFSTFSYCIMISVAWGDYFNNPGRRPTKDSRFQLPNP
ncbi:MAG TPA: hypothetical protein VJ044_18355 [Candidatus Hodarchaeales archaeon]|nr:hypothetical protein [Candidatus Hodarchaeales archaeon]